ncbi:MAG: hypothetical protein D6738_03020 [Acidobacteria bacterium]|nr:MAG: hypothetical protein D6738_03020 [Acidobacteriota bacterium]
MSGVDPRARLEAIARALSIGRAERHVFVCVPSCAKCAPPGAGERAWKHLKKRLKELGLDSPPPRWRGEPLEKLPETPAGTGRVLRTKVDCLRICEQGPIVVVYPDGTWYRGVDEQVMERIVTEHLVAGRPVEEHVFAVAPL